MKITYRLFAFITLVLWVTSAWAAAPIALLSQAGAELLSNTYDGFRASLSYSELESFDVTTIQGTFSSIAIPNWGASQRIGEPRVPVYRRIFAAPLDAEIIAEVESYTTREIGLSDYGIQYPLLPVQRSLAKNQTPQDVPFEYDATAYAAQGYGDRPIVSVEELGIMRGLRLFALNVEPVRYDPTNRSLLVYNDLQIGVQFVGGNDDATRALRARTASPYFEGLYEGFVWNYRDDNLDEDITRYPVSYVIVSDPMFEAQLQPFIQWKIKKGFRMIVGYTNDPNVGTTTTSIKNYLQGLYNAGTPEQPAPSFVLLVGDVAQIPAYTGITGSHPTDLHYARLDGLGNYIPDMYYGRFSASTTAQLQPQIDKTLEYEQYTMPDPAYLGRCVMIAGMDDNYGQVWANGQINYGTTYYFNTAHGLTSNTYLYPASGSSDAQIIANASDGRGYMNYTAHGSPSGWADPSFSVTNVNGLTNAHKYGTVVGNCCLTSKFNETTCFGEAWLRAENKGAVGYIGATNNSYWDEDYWWGVGYRASIVQNPTYSATALGAYDGSFHDHGEAFSNWYMSQYGMTMAGNLAVVQSGSSLINYYWEIYSVMGDPSLATYFGVPSANTVSYPAQILIGQTSIDITADPYSYVGLSFNGELSVAGLVDADGSICLSFASFTAPGDADIVITRQNRQPVISTIQIIPNEGPFLTTTNVTVNDDDGDGFAEFGEPLQFTLTESNVGSEDATGVVMTLSEADNHFAFGDAVHNYGTIAAGGEVSIPNGFAGTVSPNVPDGHEIQVDITAADDASNQWTDQFTFIAVAPKLALVSAIVNDASGNNNGVMDPGETVALAVTILNDGSVRANAISGMLSTDYVHASITDPAQQLAGLDPDASGTFPDFTVSIASDAPSMDRAFFYVLAAMEGGRYEYLLIEMPIGGFSDAVESGAGSWTHAANQTGWNDQWHISTEQYHSASHAWKCGDTGTGNYASHMDAVLVTPAISLPAHAELRFWHQMNGEVSSVYPDSAYDGGILEISANGGAWTQINPGTGGYNKIVRRTSGGGNPYTGPFTGGIPCWSGTIAWSEVVMDLAAYSGSIQLRFRFGSDNAGGLEGWYVDDIRIGLVTANNPPQNLTAFIGDESSAYLEWQSPASGAITGVLLGYNIYRDGAQLESLWQGCHFSDPLGELPYGTYGYQVSAVYSNGESTLSNTASVDWQAPALDRVADLTVAASGNDIILRWSPVEDATEYHVYSSDTPNEFTETPIVVTETACTLADEVSGHEKRYFMVTAVRN